MELRLVYLLSGFLLFVKVIAMSISMERSSRVLPHSQILQKIVLDASRHDNEASGLDLGGVAWLEHINLVVGDAKQAESFYQDFLGCTRDPQARFHVNLGQQQFHLAETGDPAQVVAGSIGLAVPSLKRIRERLPQAESDLKGTMFQVIEDSSESITLSCPWGNCFHLFDLEAEQDRKSSSDSIHKMVQLHADNGAYAARMAVRGQPGIRFLEIACPQGACAGLAEFYRQLLDCTVSLSTDDESRSSAIVSVGPGVHLIFRESSDVTEEDMEQMKGVHVCIYSHNFKGLYDRLYEKGLIWTNPRFTHLDSCDTWSDAYASRTLRFKDIVDLNSGEKLLELEHETRPLRHGQYMKAPFYEMQ